MVALKAGLTSEIAPRIHDNSFYCLLLPLSCLLFFGALVLLFSCSIIHLDLKTTSIASSFFLQICNQISLTLLTQGDFVSQQTIFEQGRINNKDNSITFS